MFNTKLYPRYKTLINYEYKHRNKEGGWPTIIKIPVGSIGTKVNNTLVFYELPAETHNPFLYWEDVLNEVERV